MSDIAPESTPLTLAAASMLLYARACGRANLDRSHTQLLPDLLYSHVGPNPRRVSPESAFDELLRLGLVSGAMDHWTVSER